MKDKSMAVIGIHISFVWEITLQGTLRVKYLAIIV